MLVSRAWKTSIHIIRNLTDDGHRRGHEEHNASDSDDPPVQNTAPLEKSADEPTDEKETSASPSVETLSEKTAQKSANPLQGTGIHRAGQQTIRLRRGRRLENISRNLWRCDQLVAQARWTLRDAALLI